MSLRLHRLKLLALLRDLPPNLEGGLYADLRGFAAATSAAATAASASPPPDPAVVLYYYDQVPVKCAAPDICAAKHARAHFSGHGYSNTPGTTVESRVAVDAYFTETQRLQLTRKYPNLIC